MARLRETTGDAGTFWTTSTKRLSAAPVAAYVGPVYRVTVTRWSAPDAPGDVATEVSDWSDRAEAEAEAARVLDAACAAATADGLGPSLHREAGAARLGADGAVWHRLTAAVTALQVAAAAE